MEETTKPHLVLGMTTRDGFAVATTLLFAHLLAVRLGRVFSFVIQEASQIVRGRNLVVAEVRARLPTYHQAGLAIPTHLLWCDADMVWEEAMLDPLAEMIRTAEARNLDVGAFYLRADRRPTWLTGSDWDHLVPIDWEAVQPGTLTPLRMMGFGLAYVRIDWDYQFRADTRGEDYYYWRDHPDRIPYGFPLKVWHKKFQLL